MGNPRGGGIPNDRTGAFSSGLARAGRSGCLATALAFVVAAVAPGHAAGPATAARVPYEVSVRVEYGDRPGAAGFLDDVRSETIRQILARRCARAVRAHGDDGGDSGDLLLSLTLGQPERQTRYDLSLADRSRQGGPPTRPDFVSELRVEVLAELLALPDLTPVRARRFRQSSTRRPLTEFEDSDEVVRDEAVREIARSAAALLCKGSRRKLRRRLEAAAADR